MSTSKIDAAKRIIKNLDGPTACARLLSSATGCVIPVNRVVKWLSSGIPAAYVPVLSQITKLPPDTIRPGYFLPVLKRAKTILHKQSAQSTPTTKRG